MIPITPKTTKAMDKISVIIHLVISSPLAHNTKKDSMTSVPITSWIIADTKLHLFFIQHL